MADQILGGLGSILPGSEVSNTGMQTVPVYQIQPDTPTFQGGEKLQDVYGTSQLPMFNFAKRVQTGEVTFDPTDPFHQTQAEALAGIPDHELEAAGIDISTKAMIAELAAPALQAVVSRAGAMAPGLGSNAKFVESLMPAAESFLPDALTGASPSIAKQYGLQAGETAINYDTALALRNQGATVLPTPDANIFKVNTNVIDAQRADAALGFGSIGDSGIVGSGKASPGMFDKGGMFSAAPGGGFAGYTPSFAQMGTSFGLDLGFSLLSGMKPKKAVKNSLISTAGMAVGTYFGGPIGGFIGSTIGKLIGGRVICNELYRQGLMSKKQVILDYKFTRDYLTPTHVRGYHFYSIYVVKQMRKGRMVNLWKHLATHRANEISYIYGERDKPDYLGKIYRRLLEWPSWLIGAFCPTSDWTILYKNKEIENG
tara:strand:+ start:117 stop:1397 length:1281 start_codon:yes stop_codon:yes gene_type:complete